ncbi:MAG: PEP/pyruvate-binding domain-containing protein [Desulfobacteraceae bacterium]|jgi:hypothetical protein
MDDYTLRFDAPSGFHVIGKGSLGGKARGLAFLHGLLHTSSQLKDDFPDVKIGIPKTLVIASSVFVAFVSENGLASLSREDIADELVASEFLKGHLPLQLKTALRSYLEDHQYPLAVRSSGMFEDARNHSYAGLYHTYMLSNDQPDTDIRLDNLVQAIKLVFASTFYQGPKAYAKRVGHRLETGRMAVIIQQVAGTSHGNYYYPAISGVAQSRNYYPPVGMKPEEGVATIALGLGKQVVSGERALRFCPKYPKRLLQRSSVEQMLAYSQRRFYALQMNAPNALGTNGSDHVVRRLINDAVDDAPVKQLAGTYVLAEHRIKDTAQIEGPKVLTFAGVLKYDLFPLSNILIEFLALGEASLNVPVEMEFAADIASSKDNASRFYLLQMRPMTASKANVKVTISPEEQSASLCYTRHAMGNHDRQHISEIVYVKPDDFDPAKTRAIARQVAEINAHVEGRFRRYLLVGPGRWGSADPWLGIPVRWADISNVAAIIETVSEKLNVEPSIGTHFFHNLVSLGISYLSVTVGEPDHFNWDWLIRQKVKQETEFVARVELVESISLKVDGRTSTGVILVAQ